MKLRKTVTIKWSEPDKTQSLSESVFYDVECFLCKKNICNLTCANAIFSPGNENIRITFVAVTSLMAAERYQFRVHPKNNLNKNILKNEWKYLSTEHFMLLTYQSQSKHYEVLYLFLL